MILRYSFLFLILFLFCSSCRIDLESTKASNAYAHGDSNINFTEGILIKTDSLFNFDGVSNFFHFTDNTIETIIVKNRNVIYEFDLGIGKIVKKWEFPLEGPNKVKGTHAFDGIVKIDESKYLLFYHMMGEIYQIEPGMSNVLFQFATEERDKIGFYSNAIRFPILNVKNEKEVIFPLMNTSRLESFTKAFAFGKFNTDSQKLDRIINYPPIYDKFDWGDVPYPYIASIQYIPIKEQYFISFPLDHGIYIYDQKFDLIGRRHLQSKYIAKISPFRNEKLTWDDQIDPMESRKYYGQTSYYMGGFFDPSTQLYYRLVRRAIENESGDHDYQYSFIICNLDLEIIDEVTIDSDKYNIFRTFVCSEGLMLLNESKMLNESEIPFDRMKVEYPL
jgi:hypothetical protein